MPEFKLRMPDPGSEPPTAGGGEPTPTPAENENGAEARVVLFPAAHTPSPKQGLLDQVTPAAQRALVKFAEEWRDAWVGDGILGRRPRPVADLVRQFWLDPPPYVRDAIVLRVPYAVYGAIVIPVTVATHLILLIISYPSLLIGVALLVGILSLVI
mgnify:FL=1